MRRSPQISYTKGTKIGNRITDFSQNRRDNALTRISCDVRALSRTSFYEPRGEPCILRILLYHGAVRNPLQIHFSKAEYRAEYTARRSVHDILARYLASYKSSTRNMRTK